jgi:hypothetical protein
LNGAVPVTPFNPSQAHVTAVTSRSAVALGGIRNAAQAAFVVPNAPPILTLTNELYTVLSIASLKVGTGFAVGVPRPTATAALDLAAETNVLARQQLQVAPIFAKAA